MSYDAPFVLEGTALSGMMHDQEYIMENELLFPSYHLRYANPLRCMITTQQTIVEQCDVLSGRTDMQGICWRDGERGKAAYRNYLNKIQSTIYYQGRSALKENRETLEYASEFYSFRFTNTNMHCSHRHPQLRNLVCATSKNDIYFLNQNAVQHYCPQLRTSKTILGQPLKTLHARVPDRITTMAALDEFLLVGGEDGSFTFLNLRSCENPIFDSFTNGEYMEVNGIEMSYSRTGAPIAYISANNNQLRCVDLRTLTTCAAYPTDWFVNYASQSPDGHMIGVVGDHLEGHVMSVNSKEKIATLKGHQRYSFSVAWSPDSLMLATGSDDRSTCIYDTRKLSDPVHVMSMDVTESVRSLHYSTCGRYLIMAEDRNFVHIVDASSDYSKAQKLDFVGDISGVGLTPDGDGLFIGVSNPIQLSSILEFEKRSVSQLKDKEWDDIWS